MALTELIGNRSNYKPLANEDTVKLLRLLMNRIQQYVFRNRIRVKEFFKDFDPLNRGFVTGSQFIRGLSAMGIGRLHFTENEQNILLKHYTADPEMQPALICWTQFMDDVDSIFGQREIEKMPLVLTPSPDHIVKLPVPGTTCLDDLPLKTKQPAETALFSLRKRVQADQCDLAHFFREFDRHKNGHITAQQFRQILSMLNYYLCEKEVEALTLLYSDTMGFNYPRLVHDIKPIAKNQNCQLSRSTKALPTCSSKPEEADLKKILQKLLARIKRRKPKLFNFLREHDRLNHGYISGIDFHRALDRAGFELTEKEIKVLASTFKLTKRDDSVLWREFLRLIDYLVAETVQFGKDASNERVVDSKQRNTYISGVKRLASTAHKRRIELRPMFRDFDVPQRGLVSQNQFLRTLDSAGLRNCISPEEMEELLRKFGVINGSKKEVQYMAFCETLSELQDR